MKNAFIYVPLMICTTTFAQKKIKTLIIDGQNNHDQWPKTTIMVKKMLEETGRFEVDIYRTASTWKGDSFLVQYTPKNLPPTIPNKDPKPDPNFAPKFSKYKLVISNLGWNAAVLPATTQEALEKFVKKGGGLVVFHAADNSFPEWKAYNEMIGLGGWGNRDEKSGPYVYYNNEGKLVTDTAKGRGGSHGPQHEYVIKIREPEHPITKGMPAEWLHTKDELYDKLRGPAKNMTILATAFSSPQYKGTDRHEPALMVLKFGKGRIFHNIMGHVDYSVECVGFISTMQRGSEWAATGKVTIPIPTDFPTVVKTVSRPFNK
jgi:uncharacterized protein